MVASGRLEVVGRWSGTFGRRFVRPALIFPVDTGRHRRVLADLDDRPWTANDGVAWRATFAVGDQAPSGPFALSVAPEITVELHGEVEDGTASELVDATGAADASPAAALARAPGALDGPRAVGATPRPDGDRPTVARPPDGGRLSARLAAAEAELDHERARRAEVEAALAARGVEARRAEAESARLHAELELAQAVQLEARGTASELDAARHEGHLARSRLAALADEHERTLRAHAEELEDRDRELRTLREELAAIRESARPVRCEAAAHPDRRDDDRPGHPPDVEHRESGRDDRRHEDARAHRRESAGSSPVDHPTAHPPHSDRPVNPSLRHSSWLTRLLALLVLAAVILAIWVVLHSTVLR